MAIVNAGQLAVFTKKSNPKLRQRVEDVLLIAATTQPNAWSSLRTRVKAKRAPVADETGRKQPVEERLKHAVVKASLIISTLGEH